MGDCVCVRVCVHGVTQRGRGYVGAICRVYMYVHVLFGFVSVFVLLFVYEWASLLWRCTMNRIAVFRLNEKAASPTHTPYPSATNIHTHAHKTPLFTFCFPGGGVGVVKMPQHEAHLW